jgi:ACS family glucarate transporter-like MFS transporter/ACS family D-galactonate transporter-like MFS transporter
MGFAGGFLGFYLSRFINGIAQAGIFPCCVKTISYWFPPSQKAMPSGLLAAFMSVGGAMASSLTAFFLYYLDWKTIFLLYTLPGFFAAIWFYSWFRDRPQEHPSVNAEELALLHSPFEGQKPHLTTTEKTPWGMIFGSPQVWWICGQQFFRAAGYIFFATWFPTYLQKTQGVSVSASGYLSSLPLVGVVLGSGSGGFIMDWIWQKTGSKQLSRRGMGLLSAGLTHGFFLLAFFCNDLGVIIILLTFGSVCSALAGPAAYTVTIDLGGRHVATVFSTMNMAGNLGATLLPIVVEF